MAKRKKNKHHAKNKRDANAPVEAANATESLADEVASEVDTSVDEAPEAQAAADNAHSVESSSAPESEAAAVEEAAPSELTSDPLVTELEADASGVVEEPKVDAVAAPVESEAETGKGNRKNKKGKKAAAAEAAPPAEVTEQAPVSDAPSSGEAVEAPAVEPDVAAVETAPEVPAEEPSDKAKRKKGKKAAKAEATAATSDENVVSPGENADAEPGAEPAATTESEPAAEAALADATVDGEEGNAPAQSETGDGEGATESSVDGVEAEAASEDGQAEAGEAVATSDDSTTADGASEADGAIEGTADGAGEGTTDGEAGSDSTADPNALDGDRLESIIESLLFASDKALSLADLKRLLGDRDGKKITAAVQSLIQKRMDTGIQVVTLSTGWHLRTSVDNAEWVSKLLVGKPVRLSRAMMETLAIVAYRQPVTRPEVDDIRGVDCGAVLKTLLDRGLVRIIGKKEEVGRPMLYGTTQEFLRVFNLRDLTELPTLREFYDLSAEDQSKVDAEAPQTPSATTAKPEVALNSVARGALAPEDEDADPLLDELDAASKLAKKALGEREPDEKAEEDKPEEPQSEATANNEPESTPAGE